MRNIWLLILLLGWLSVGCRSDDPKPTPFCGNMADFKIGKKWKDTMIYSDTFYVGHASLYPYSIGDVFFEIKNPLPNVDYTWQIGYDANPRFGSKTGIHFGSDGKLNIGASLPITVVAKTKNGEPFACDTLNTHSYTKHMVVYPLDSMTIYGHYDGIAVDENGITKKIDFNIRLLSWDELENLGYVSETIPYYFEGLVKSWSPIEPYIGPLWGGFGVGHKWAELFSMKNENTPYANVIPNVNMDYLYRKDHSTVTFIEDTVYIRIRLRFMDEEDWTKGAPSYESQKVKRNYFIKAVKQK